MLLDVWAALLIVVVAAESRPAASVDGVVRGPDGRPVAGAEVSAFRIGRPESLCGSKSPVGFFEHCAASHERVRALLATKSLSAVPIAKATTDAQGRFEIATAEQSVDLWVNAPAGQVVRLDVDPGKPALDLVLTDAAPVWIRSLRSTAASPAPKDSAQVWVIAERPRIAWRAKETAGGWEANGVPGGVPLWALLSAPGCQLEWRSFSPPETGEAVCTEALTVRGRVLDGNAGVAGARVWVSPDHDGATTVSGPDGAFELIDARAGSIVASDATRVGEAMLSWDKLNEVQISLRPAATLRLEVRDRKTGAPIAGANPYASQGGLGAWVHFEEVLPGVFEAKHLRRGRLEISVSADDYLFSASEAVELKTAEVTVVRRLTRGFPVTGTVGGKTMAPVAGASVCIRSPGAGLPERCTTTNPAGRFRLVTNRGPKQIEVRAAGHVPRNVNALVPLKRPVEVALEPETRGVVITLLEPDGTPARGGWIDMDDAASPHDFRFHMVSHQRPNALGQITVPLHTAGTFTLVGHADGFAPSASREVAVQDSWVNVELRLQPGLAASGVILQMDGTPLTNRALSIAGQPITTGPKGEFSLVGLEPGEHEITFPETVKRGFPMGLVRFSGTNISAGAHGQQILVAPPKEEP